MKTKTNFTPEPSEAEIQHIAYQLWIESGRPAGHDLEHWFAAKELILHHHGRPATTHRKSTLLSPAHPPSSQPNANN